MHSRLQHMLVITLDNYLYSMLHTHVGWAVHMHQYVLTYHVTHGNMKAFQAKEMLNSCILTLLPSTSGYLTMRIMQYPFTSYATSFNQRFL